MIWALMAGTTIAALVALLWPLLRAPREAKDRAAYDMEIFQDQLKEVDRDLERRVLTEAEAAAARIEIQRRVLSAGRAKPELHRIATRGRRIALAGGLAVVVPVLALVIYLSVGAPDLVVHNQAQAEAETDRLVQQLAERVAAEPNNSQGVALLARSYRQLGRWDDAAKMYERLVALQPDADSFASYGEVLTAGSGGTVSAVAHDAFMKALSLNREDPRARFYLGLEQAAKNNPRDAIAIWRDLTASAPPDAPWLGMVRQQMTEVAQAAGIPPMSVAPRHPLAAAGPETAATPSPSTPEQRFSPEQQQMIQGMVGGLAARLEANPNDFDGWMMLGRSYTVLQKTDDAGKAYEKAAALRPTEIEPKVRLAATLLSSSDLDTNQKLPVRLVQVAGEILKLDPAQPDALFIAGLDRAKAGDKAAAVDFWTRAQKALPDTAARKADIARRMKALKND